MRVSVDEIEKFLCYSINGDISALEESLQNHYGLYDVSFSDYEELKLDSYYIIEEIIAKGQIQNLSAKSTKELRALKFPIIVVAYLRGLYILKEQNLSCEKKYNIFGLPENMTIGIEIETSNPTICQLSPWLIKGWGEEIDLTTISPEIISPILHDTEEDVRNIYLMCEYLQDLRSKGF